MFSKSDRKKFIPLLGGKSKAEQFLDDLEPLIEQTWVQNQIAEPATAKQKSELEEFARKARELSLLLENMSFDTGLTLRVGIEEANVRGTERHSDGLIDWSEQLPRFPDRDAVLTVQTQLRNWSKVASDQANWMKPAVGPRHKSERDAFVREVVGLHREIYGQKPPRGSAEAFHGVVQDFCALAGFDGKPDIEKVIKAAQRDIDSEVS